MGDAPALFGTLWFSLLQAGIQATLACGPQVDPPEDSETAGQTDADPSMTVSVGDSTSGGTTDSEPESSSTTGTSFDEDAFRGMCESIQTQEECDAVPWVEVPHPVGMTYVWCTWETWIVVALVDGECVFGAVEAGCEMEDPGGPKCNPPPDCWDGSGGGVWHIDDRGVVEVGNGSSWCGYHGRHCTDDPEVPAECTCMCDPGWPGVPPPR